MSEGSGSWCPLPPTQGHWPHRMCLLPRSGHRLGLCEALGGTTTLHAHPPSTSGEPLPTGPRPWLPLRCLFPGGTLPCRPLA